MYSGSVVRVTELNCELFLWKEKETNGFLTNCPQYKNASIANFVFAIRKELVQ